MDQISLPGVKSESSPKRAASLQARAASYSSGRSTLGAIGSPFLATGRSFLDTDTVNCECTESL